MREHISHTIRILSIFAYLSLAFLAFLKPLTHGPLNNKDARRFSARGFSSTHAAPTRLPLCYARRTSFTRKKASWDDKIRYNCDECLNWESGPWQAPCDVIMSSAVNMNMKIIQNNLYIRFASRQHVCILLKIFSSPFPYSEILNLRYVYFCRPAHRRGGEYIMAPTL